MSTDMPPLSHMLPWRVKGKLLFYTQSYPELNCSELMSTPTPSTLSQLRKIVHPMLRTSCSSCTPKVHARKSCRDLEEMRP